MVIYSAHWHFRRFHGDIRFYRLTGGFFWGFNRDFMHFNVGLMMF
jgi:hypothetical protein